MMALNTHTHTLITIARLPALAAAAAAAAAPNAAEQRPSRHEALGYYYFTTATLFTCLSSTR